MQTKKINLLFKKIMSPQSFQEGSIWTMLTTRRTGSNDKLGPIRDVLEV